MKTIYQALMPSAFGYGLEAFADNPEEAEKLLKKEFYKLRKSNLPYISHTHEHFKTFTRSMEYFGGTMREVIIPSSGEEDFSEVLKDYTDSEEL